MSSRIRILIILSFTVFAPLGFTGVDLGFSGESMGPGDKVLLPKACNHTPLPQLLKGWRFRAPSFEGWKTWYGNLSHTGSGPYAYQQDVPDYDEKVLPGTCQGVPVDYHGSMSAAQDGTPFNPQLLMKTGTCNIQPPYQDAAPVQCAEIPGLQASPDYYADRCIVDTLGINGGDNSGGFVSTFHGETQIQAAIPARPFLLNATDVRWDPKSLGGPMYMMSLAMAQEYLNVDMQFLQSIDGKETMFGFVQAGNEAAGSISEWQNYNRDDDQVFSPWEVESFTFGKVVQAYPGFFAKYGPCAAAAADVWQAMPCADGDWGKAAAFYMRTPGAVPTKTGPDSPQLANATITAALTFYWLYDALMQSTDLCFGDVLVNGKDKRMGLAALIPGYNLGPNSGFDEPLRDRALRNDPNASQAFQGGVSDYRDNVFRLLDVFIAASKASKSCGGKNPIYDEALTFPEIRKFFFGGRDTLGTPETQGDGGLLLHFALTLEQRALIHDDLQCAFDRLKGKSPSTLGQEAISYRYDWLTLLRAVKARLPLQRPMPVQEEFRNWVGARSLNPKTCSGIKKDEAFPFLSIDAPRPNPMVAESFQVLVTASDETKVSLVEWTLDSTWAAWIPASKSFPDQYGFRVAFDQPAYPKPGQSGVLWIRASDGCRNSTVQRLDFTVKADAVFKTSLLQVSTPVANPPSQDFMGTLLVTLSVANPGADIFYTLDGTVPAGAEGGATRKYRGPIQVTSAVTIMAMGAKDGFRNSEVMSESYGIPPAQKRIRLSATFPNGSALVAVPGLEPQPGSAVFIPVNSLGEPLPGNADGKCGGCFAGVPGMSVGPVFHLGTQGPVDYDFKIFTNLGEFVVAGSGRITSQDLPTLKKPEASNGMLYDVPIVWTGRTRSGLRAGTGAYVLKAEFRFPEETQTESPAGKQTERLIFGMLRK